MAWQPIETAPRDGTRVLTVRKTSMGHYRPRTAYWCQRYGAGITGASGWKCALGHHWIYPDFWMPLPEPPESK